MRKTGKCGVSHLSASSGSTCISANEVTHARRTKASAAHQSSLVRTTAAAAAAAAAATAGVVSDPEVSFAAAVAVLLPYELLPCVHACHSV